MKKCLTCDRTFSDNDLTLCQECGAQLKSANSDPGSQVPALLSGSKLAAPSIAPPVLPVPSVTAAAPAPRIIGNWRIFALVALAIFSVPGIVGLIIGIRSPVWRGQILFSAQMLLLAIALSVTPTVSYYLTKSWNRFARGMLETIAFTIIFALFHVWLWGTAMLGQWLKYTIILMLLLEVGGHLVEWNKIKTIGRLSKSKLFVNLQTDAEAVERMFRHERFIYLPVPLGLVVGMLWGMLRGWDSRTTVFFSLQLVFCGAALILLVFLVIGFVRMADPLFENSDLTEPVPKAKKPRGQKKFRLKATATTKETQIQKALDLAVMIVDLRKVYLFDSAHNVVLLVAFAAVALRWGAGNKILLFTALLVLTFVFNHLPYIIGQSRLHERVLEGYEGLARARISAQLREHAPYFPRWEFLVVILTSSPAGGVVYFLLEHFVINVLDVNESAQSILK